jgi:flagellar secretion chaperone FliS
MKTTGIELSYRKSAIEGASPIGLVIALYDRLSGDLRRAASAIRENDIEERCSQLNHAALILGQLENWIDKANGGDLAANLSALYAHLRSKLMEASLKQSASIIDTQIELILSVRGAWHQRDTPSVQTADRPAGDVVARTGAYASPLIERVAFSQSA